MATLFTPGEERPANVFGTRGASCGTTTTSALLAKATRAPGLTSCCCSAWRIVSWSALANTSTGAPLAICCSNAPEAAKLSCTRVPGFAASKPAPISLKACVRLAAAETVRSAATAVAPAIDRARPASTDRTRRSSVMVSAERNARRTITVAPDANRPPGAAQNPDHDSSHRRRRLHRLAHLSPCTPPAWVVGSTILQQSPRLAAAALVSTCALRRGGVTPERPGAGVRALAMRRVHFAARGGSAERRQRWPT